MRECDDRYVGRRQAEAAGKWCIGECQAKPSNYMVIELKRSVSGLRFDSAAGERKTIRWREVIPRTVAQCRAGGAIDWGGASVQRGDYTVIYDGQGQPPNMGFKNG